MSRHTHRGHSLTIAAASGLCGYPDQGSMRSRAIDRLAGARSGKSLKEEVVANGRDAFEESGTRLSA
jgi:hypothetical protein